MRSKEPIEVSLSQASRVAVTSRAPTPPDRSADTKVTVWDKAASQPEPASTKTAEEAKNFAFFFAGQNDQVYSLKFSEMTNNVLLRRDCLCPREKCRLQKTAPYQCFSFRYLSYCGSFMLPLELNFYTLYVRGPFRSTLISVLSELHVASVLCQLIATYVNEELP